MKSEGSFVLVTKMLSGYCMILLLVLTYSLSILPASSFPLHSDPLEKAMVVFDDADTDLSSDSESDLIDELIVKTFDTDLFIGFLSNLTKNYPVGSQAFSAVHLEILIPPPRLNS